jgi:acyl carrier protein
MELRIKMVVDPASPVLEAVAASIRGAGWSGDGPVRADDNLKDLGLSRLGLLAVLIDIEDKLGTEFPADATAGFRIVGDIALHIQSHEMTSYDDPADECLAVINYPGQRDWSARECLNWICARVFGRALVAVGLAGG